MEELNVPTLLLKFVRSVLRWSSIMILVGIIMMVYSGLNAQTDGFVYNINSGVAVEFSSKYIKQDQDLQFSVDLMSYNGEAINYDTEKILSLVVQKSETSTFEKYDIVITMTGNNMDLYKSVGEGYYRLVITNSGDKDATVMISRAQATQSDVIIFIIGTVAFAVGVSIFATTISLSLTTLCLLIVIYPIYYLINHELDANKRRKELLFTQMKA